MRGGQFGGAVWLFCPVLIVDRKLFRGLDSVFQRFLRVFQVTADFLRLAMLVFAQFLQSDVARV